MFWKLKCVCLFLASCVWLGGFAPLQLVSFWVWGCSLRPGLVKPRVVPAAGLVWDCFLPHVREEDIQREREQGWGCDTAMSSASVEKRGREGAGRGCDWSSLFSGQNLIESFPAANL